MGGFMNFVPKTARSESAKWLEKASGKATVTYGSYDEKIASSGDRHTIQIGFASGRTLRVRRIGRLAQLF